MSGLVKDGDGYKLSLLKVLFLSFFSTLPFGVKSRKLALLALLAAEDASNAGNTTHAAPLTQPTTQPTPQHHSRIPRIPHQCITPSDASS